MGPACHRACTANHRWGWQVGAKSGSAPPSRDRRRKRAASTSMSTTAPPRALPPQPAQSHASPPRSALERQSQASAVPGNASSTSGCSVATSSGRKCASARAAWSSAVQVTGTRTGSCARSGGRGKAAISDAASGRPDPLRHRRSRDPGACRCLRAQSYAHMQSSRGARARPVTSRADLFCPRAQWTAFRLPRAPLRRRPVEGRLGAAVQVASLLILPHLRAGSSGITAANQTVNHGLPPRIAPATLLETTGHDATCRHPCARRRSIADGINITVCTLDSVAQEFTLRWL